MAYIPLNLTTEGDDGRRVASASAQPFKPRRWTYMTTDSVATVRVISYFHDAFQRGMRAGDLVTVVVVSGDWPLVTVTAASQCMVMTCAQTTGADLADGTSLSVTNSD